MSRFVVISGLPASGKSTLATALSNALSLPLIDKDDILESLFDSLGVGDAHRRAELSRAADHAMQKIVSRSQGAVIASWWRHPKSTVASGSPADWLKLLPGEIIELHCKCSPQPAVDRFFARTRHAGHLDGSKSKAEEIAKFEQFASYGALGIGRLIEVDTEQTVNLDVLLRRIATA